MLTKEILHVGKVLQLQKGRIRYTHLRTNIKREYCYPQGGSSECVHACVCVCVYVCVCVCVCVCVLGGEMSLCDAYMCCGEGDPSET